MKKTGRPRKYWAYFEFLGFMEGKQEISEKEWFRPQDHMHFAFRNRNYSLRVQDGEQTTALLADTRKITFEFKDRGRNFINYRFKEIS